MKSILVYLIFMNVVLGNLLLVAMEQQPVYPWYQSYKNPVVRQKIVKGLQTTKEFIKQYKHEIALIAAVMGATYIGNRGYTKIARAFKNHGLDAESLDKGDYRHPEALSEELLKLAISAYIRPKIFFGDYWNNTIMNSVVFERLDKREQEAFYKAIVEIVGIKRSF